MKKLYLVFLFLFEMSIIKSPLYSRTIEKSLSVYIIEEQVNGIRFTHRSDLIDGKTHELWAIQGQNVNHEEYEKAILDAEIAERRLARRAQEEERKREQKFKVHAHYDILKKLIQNLSIESNKELTKIRNPLLVPFLQFTHDTFESHEALYEVEQQLERAQKLSQNSDIHEIQELKEIVMTLELYPEKLVKLYQDSVNHAIKTCDNTRALKELLALVS